MKYKKLTGVILKKQNYREADQIVTIWTREWGKVRFLARGARRPASKLGYHLQDFSYLSLELVGQHLPVMVNGSSIRNFKTLLSDLNKIGAVCYGAELMIRLTADEHPNTAAFDLWFNFLDAVDRQPSGNFQPEVSAFSLALVRTLGFGHPTPVEDLDFAQVNDIMEQLLERHLKSKAFLTLNT